jgi:hypothetical protein
MIKEELISRIAQAYAGVVLGDGVGLNEGQAIDDYESDELRRNKREKDEKSNWNDLDPLDLQSCSSSLSFFDAKGMRFHLPAYLVQSILGKVDDPLFHLLDNSGYSTGKHDLLNTDQTLAIIDYLEWCLEHEEFGFEHPQIKRSLLEYWIPKSNK